MDTNSPQSQPNIKKRKREHYEPIRSLTGKPQTCLNNEFLNYYKAQNIVPEEEWEVFEAAWYRDLPTTFRFNTVVPQYQQLIDIFKNVFCSDPNLYHTQIDNQDVNIEPPKALQWYPDALAWSFSASRKALRATKPFKHLKHFLNIESEIGNITRQEAVSMLPALFLDVQPHHKILDMCAAPGSKTCQLLEMIHKVPDPTGFVVANDADVSRSYVLVHHTQRLSSPNLMVINMNGQDIPLMDDGKGGKLYFDRILCDVPCTSDGTIRKAPNVGHTWGARYFKIHKLQSTIARRGIELLEVGGRMVYSTCSLNPLENEAVVAHLLREAKGALRLINVSNELPELIRRPGLTTWKVMDSKKTFDEYDAKFGRLAPSMFPPTEEENNTFNLPYCMRLYPHLQDTGGFFVAVLEKTDFIAPVAQTAQVVETVDEDEVPDEKKKGVKIMKFTDEPFAPLEGANKEEFRTSICNFFGIDKENPLFNRLLVRNREAATTPLNTFNFVYSVNDALFSLLKVNALDIPIISAGLKCFENTGKQNRRLQLNCNWRIVKDAFPLLGKSLTKRIITITFAEFMQLLSSPDANKGVLFTDTTSLKDLAQDMAEVGCIQIRVLPDESHSALHFAGWRGKSSLVLGVTKEELKELKNIYLTDNYTYDFNDKLRVANHDKRRKLAEPDNNEVLTAETKEETKEQVAEDKMEQ